MSGIVRMTKALQTDCHNEQEGVMPLAQCLIAAKVKRQPERAKAETETVFLDRA
ncbi:MAG: hypothetical protein RDA78_14400 [Roseibium sp.]|uniref:hypothetical protein n=1 Tax=Roseibium sp. TaxID=1936156 RepID=UPI003D9C6455